MTWEQQFAALKALDIDTYLTTLPDGKWLCRVRGLELGGDGVLVSISGRGKSPQEATENLWMQIEAMPSDRYLVLGAMRDTRRHVRWNGFMWIDLATK